MKLHMPHPIRRSRQRRADQAAQVEQAVARSGLRNRAPLAWDWADEMRRRQQMGRWDR